MLKILRTRLPTDEATLRAALAKYQAALAGHAKTVNVPAPWPDFEILLYIVRAGVDFLVVEDEEIEKQPMTKEQALAEVDRRAGQARRRYIGAEPGQETVYLLKREEARAFADDGYAGGSIPPFVQAELDAAAGAAQDGAPGALTAKQAAELILDQAASWGAAAASIEAVRRKWKIRIANAAAPYEDLVGGAAVELDALLTGGAGDMTILNTQRGKT